ncbi:MAG: lnt [Segetibacter sp.]|nr:lnt [Segetibacter sp.]
MQKFTSSFWIGSVLSGILTFVAVCQINSLVCWLCYIPLFLAITNSTAKQAFQKGLLFGSVFSAFAFFWMIPGAERFTGNSIVYGLIVFLLSAIFISLFYACLLFCFSLLMHNKKFTRSLLIQGLLVASVFCIGEAVLTLVTKALPWFDIHSGNGLAASLYTIQPASIFGIHFLSFIVVLVNFIAAEIILNRTYVKLYIPIVIMAIYISSGYVVLQLFENKLQEGKPFSVAILAENIPPTVKWDDNNADMLAERLLDLNKSAVLQKPHLILWSESAIPWTYRKDDDLVNAVLSITNRAHVTHVMGINTAIKDNVVHNSAYCILPSGEVSSRYDKQYLLSFIEKPLRGIVMPFFSSRGFVARTDKEHAAPLNTPFGKAGMLICNEAAVPAAASAMVNKGAQFLLNISNDGWFKDTYIARLHYYYARLRAVESRKDIAINCNNGYSGLIKASGVIKEQRREEEPFVQMATIQPNNEVSLASTYPNLFVYACALCVIVAGVINYSIRGR